MRDYRLVSEPDVELDVEASFDWFPGAQLDFCSADRGRRPDKITARAQMNATPSFLFGRLKKLHSYFARNALADPLFEPERLAAEEVVALIRARGAEPRPELLRAAFSEVIAAVERSPHYDGSGWLELKILVDAWLAAVEAEGGGR